MHDPLVFDSVAVRVGSAASFPSRTDFDCAHFPAALDAAQPCGTGVGALGPMRDTA